MISTKCCKFPARAGIAPCAKNGGQVEIEILLRGEPSRKEKWLSLFVGAFLASNKAVNTNGLIVMVIEFVSRITFTIHEMAEGVMGVCSQRPNAVFNPLPDTKRVGSFGRGCMQNLCSHPGPQYRVVESWLNPEQMGKRAI